MEILIGLAKSMGYTKEELFIKRLKKKKERGGFSKRIVLEKVNE
jgi:predicted house-cleaning noncanonical NTP pyrophosphatase (MazG superfamily)